MKYSKWELLEKIRNCGISDTEILEHFLVWLSDDEACEALLGFIVDLLMKKVLLCLAE